ncbi:MAG: phosphoribosylformylglycinamidine cyclo-ligase [Planctomycetota bacterium]
MAKLTYRDAGLDLELYEQALAGIVPFLKRTHSSGVLDGFGGFASLFDLGIGKKKYRDPILVTCTDGVGTKLKVACMMGKHDTVGIDLVAMSVNDALCTGAEPLTFLDYIALPKDDPALIRDLVKGISDGCLEAGCSLVGGETAILPDFYKPGDYDMAGFCAGVVERERIVDGRAVEVGDVILGLASSGLHSNGYSLARKVAFDHLQLKATDHVEELGTTVGEELLTPTRIYVKAIHALLDRFGKKGLIHGLAHITGEGLPGNVPRVLPKGKKAVLRKESWPLPPVFNWLQKNGGIDDDEMFTVFNMGIGFVVIVDPAAADKVQQRLIDDHGIPTFAIGEVKKGKPAVEWKS